MEECPSAHLAFLLTAFPGSFQKREAARAEGHLWCSQHETCISPGSHKGSLCLNHAGVLTDAGSSTALSSRVSPLGDLRFP